MEKKLKIMANVKKEIQINSGDRIAQLLLFPYIKGKATPGERTVGLLEVLGKCVFWHIVVNDQRFKLMVQMNGIDIEGLVDIRADVSILSQKSWNPDWPLQKVYTQFIGIGKLSQIRQSVPWGYLCGTGRANREVVLVRVLWSHRTHG